MGGEMNKGFFEAIGIFSTILLFIFNIFTCVYVWINDTELSNLKLRVSEIERKAAK